MLGLDTSSAIATFAIVSDSKITASIERPAASHGAALPGAVDEILRDAGIVMRDLGAIAVGVGPGSFTGLRIGLSYAKGIAMATGCSMAGVPSFDAIALAALEHSNAPLGASICAIADARKGEAYFALYRVVGDGLEKVIEESVAPLERMASQIGDGVLFAGDAMAMRAAGLQRSRGLNAAFTELGMLKLRGGCVAAIGAAQIPRAEGARAAALEPMYVRTAEATFKPNVKQMAENKVEGVWSKERKSSFDSI